MLKILDYPEDFTLKKIDTNRKCTLSRFKGKLILLSFIETDQQLDWILHLKSYIEHPDMDFLADKIQVIAVLFSFWNNHDRETLLEKLRDKGILNEKFDFPVLLDEQWNSSVAATYLEGFDIKNIPLNLRKSSRTLFNYLIAPSFHIADKWHINSSKIDWPMSFNHIELKGPPPFNSEDLPLSVDYIIERSFKLIDEPEIIKTDPEPDTQLKELPRVTIYFSKPMLEPDITYKKHYRIEGVDAANLVIDSIEHTPKHIAENCVVLNLKGDFSTKKNNTVAIVLDKQNMRDLRKQNLVGKDTITYLADTRHPVMTSFPENGTATISVTGITLTFNKSVIIKDADVHFIVDGTRIMNVDYELTELEDNRFLLKSNLETLVEKQHGQSVEIELENICDLAGNPLIENVLRFSYDTSFPRIKFSEIEPDLSTTCVTPLEEIRIPFDQDVLHTDNHDSYTCVLNGEIFKQYTLSYQDQTTVLKLMKPLTGKAVFSVYFYNITNMAGNNLQGVKKAEFTIDTKIVAINYERILPSPEKPVNEVRYITIPFNKEVVGAGDKKNYTVTYNGRLLDFYKVFYKEQYATIQFDEPYKPEKTEAQIVVCLDNITDKLENPLAGKNSFSITIDTIPPVLLVDKIRPAVSVPVKQLDSIVIPFSKKMSRRSRKDMFQIMLDNDIDNSFQTRFNENQVIISWKKAIRSGDRPRGVTIKMNDLTDIAGNQLAGTKTITITVDSANPNIVHSNIEPSLKAPVKSLQTINIPYSKKVINGDDKDNFKMLLDGKPFTDFEVSYKDTTTTLRLGKELAPSGKTSMVSVSLFKEIMDIPGNRLDGECSFHYTIDTITPHITGIIPQPEDKTGLVSSMRISTITKITLSFSKPVKGATARSSYTLTGSGTGTLVIDHITEGRKRNTYTIYLQGSPTHGNLEIKCRGIKDHAGNSLASDTILYAVEEPRDIVIVSDSDKQLKTMRPLLDYFLSTVMPFSSFGDRVGFIIQTYSDTIATPLYEIQDVVQNKESILIGKSTKNNDFWKLLSDGLTMLADRDANGQKRGKDLLCVSLPHKPSITSPEKNRELQKKYIRITAIKKYHEKVMTMLNNTRQRIRLHCLSFGHNQFRNQHLFVLSQRSNGTFLWQYEDNFTFKAGSGLTHILPSMLDDKKLQVTTSINNKLNSKCNTEQVVLNKSVKKIIISLFWQGTKPLTFNLVKDKVPVQTDFTESQGVHYCTTHIDFPIVTGKTKIIPEGTWDIEITRQFKYDSGPVSYKLTAMVYDSKINYAITHANKTGNSGDDLACDIGIFEGKNPIETMYNIEANIEAPVTSIRKLLSDKKSIPSQSAANKFLNAISKKIDNPGLELLDQISSVVCSDKTVAETLQRVTRSTQQLEPLRTPADRRKKRKGRYGSTYSETKVPGMYTIEYKLKGLGPNSGIFERCAMTTAYIQPILASENSVMTCTYSTKIKTFFITVTLLDTHNNPIGPGRLEQVKGTLGRKKPETAVDNLNGTYTLGYQVPNMQYLKENKAKIDVAGKTVYNDIAYNIRKK